MITVLQSKQEKRDKHNPRIFDYSQSLLHYYSNNDSNNNSNDDMTGIVRLPYSHVH